MYYYVDPQNISMLLVNPNMVPDNPVFEEEMDKQGWIKFEEENFRRLQENIEGAGSDKKLIEIKRTQLTKLTQKNPSGLIGLKNDNLVKIDDDLNTEQSIMIKYPIMPIKMAKPVLMKIKGDVNVVVGERLPMSIISYFDNRGRGLQSINFLMYVAPRITFE